MKGRGVGTRTATYHLVAVRAFCRWLVEEDRIGKNPLAKLKPGKGRAGDRHKRRALTQEELQRLLVATRSSRVIRRGLSGEDRFWLYSVAVSTGLRAAELASLTPRSFDLFAESPIVHLAPEHSKNGKGAAQPLPSAIRYDLRSYLAHRPPQDPVWPGTWIAKPVAVFRPDLVAAGIPYVVVAPGGVPLHADLHSLRHTFIRMLDLAGASVKEAMQLARHSDPKLTMAVYGQANAADLAEKVNAVGDDCFPVASPLLPLTPDPR